MPVQWGTRCSATLAGASGDGASGRPADTCAPRPRSDDDATGAAAAAASRISAKSFQSQTPSGDRRVEKKEQ